MAAILKSNMADIVQDWNGSIRFLDPENVEIGPGMVLLAALLKELWAKYEKNGGHIWIQYGGHQGA